MLQIVHGSALGTTGNPVAVQKEELFAIIMLAQRTIICIENGL